MSKVYFANVRAREVGDNKVNKVERLFKAAGFGGLVGEGVLTAIKLHFGEPGSDCFIRPMFVRRVVDLLKEQGAKPFLTDSNTLYSGNRYHAVDHLSVASRHGFGMAQVDAPVIIADGLFGENVVSLPVKGRHFTEAKISGAVAKAGAMIVMSHFKGHQLAGFGGAIKNLAMGCASGAGKREQHSVRFFVKPDDCVACGECESVCPEGAASVGDEVAVIDKEKCVGCGECYQHCPEKAIDVDWATEIGAFMERMTEYALGAISGKEGKVGFINFVTEVTPDCDCLPWSDAPIVPDIGILASTDPVAIDQASLDLVNRQVGLQETQLGCNHAACEDKFHGVWAHTQGADQLTYGEEIGLGSTSYELIEI